MYRASTFINPDKRYYRFREQGSKNIQDFKSNDPIAHIAPDPDKPIRANHQIARAHGNSSHWSIAEDPIIEEPSP